MKKIKILTYLFSALFNKKKKKKKKKKLTTIFTTVARDNLTATSTVGVKFHILRKG